MSAHADEIRDAEILDLQNRVKELERRVKDLESRLVFVHDPSRMYPGDYPRRPLPPEWTPPAPISPWQIW